ncbi:hypothetical protein HanRHA438_Chr11g0513001 [Helianthus annuus]|uniref:Uncharacterized protein n=1 Tax=Helianthus annuus TaxID=4232 RepID=A0A9K3HRF8_HELAN|nr:hypothetical protein HanXRQr2_Chr11g0500231 [Helianthus annuus]KAJ0871494.1 hypothetical protein HanRHA438_Chr11g0513001 [Helianthus annuus]KAJ0875894.1 hypothetical protein HanPSC8_Chr11g0481931 [Helianthus annuus]
MASGVCASHIFYFETITTKLFGFTLYPQKMLCSLTFRPKREGLGEAYRPPRPTVAYCASGLATVLASRFWRPPSVGHYHRYTAAHSHSPAYATDNHRQASNPVPATNEIESGN